MHQQLKAIKSKNPNECFTLASPRTIYVSDKGLRKTSGLAITNRMCFDFRMATRVTSGTGFRPVTSSNHKNYKMMTTYNVPKCVKKVGNWESSATDGLQSTVTGGTTRGLVLAERSARRPGTSAVEVKDPRYCGASPWRALYVSTAILNWIRSGTRSQCD